MPKNKPYYVATFDRNKSYMPKDDPSRKSKQKKRTEDRLASTKKTSDSIDGQPKYTSAIVIGRSNFAKLFNYANNIEKLMNYKDRLNKSQEFIVNMYDTLRNDEDEILCKKDAYRRMKVKAVTAKYAIYSADNSKQIHLNTLHLASHLKAYLCAMIYPPIFENCTPNSSDIIFSKYPMLIELWCNMLEEAIILDGFIDCLHNIAMKQLCKRYNPIHYNENQYDKNYLSYKSSANFKNLLINLYMPNIFFNCYVKEFASANNPNNNEYGKDIKNILQHKFFQSGNRGIQMHSCIKYSIQYILEIYNEYLEHLKNEYSDHFKKCDKNFNGRISNLTKIFPLYNLCVQSHLLDFVWHDNFDNVDFHLTDGFLTNYVLNKIMNQNIEVIEKIADDYNDEDFHYGKKYTCNNSTELSLSSTIESYDLNFLRMLIKQCSNTFLKYDLHIKKSQAQSLVYIIKDSESFLFNDFYTNIIENHLLNKPEDTIKKLETILEKSKDYYHKIYEDNHNWNIEFPC